MTAKKKYWLAAALTLTAVGAALADTKERQIVAVEGHDKRVGVYINTRPDCSSGPLPTIRLAVAPAHGTVKIARGIFKGTNIKECLAVTVPALVAIYRPQANFIGHDEFELEVKFTNLTEMQDFRVNVLASDGHGQSL